MISQTKTKLKHFLTEYKTQNNNYLLNNDFCHIIKLKNNLVTYFDIFGKIEILTETYAKMIYGF